MLVAAALTATIASSLVVQPTGTGHPLDNDPTLPPPIVVSFDADSEPMVPPPIDEVKITAVPRCERNGSFEYRELVDCFGPGWAGLAWCESSGRSTIVALDVNNRYSRGLIQFQQRTWDYVAAELAEKPDLVGVTPESQPPNTQVEMGKALKASQGLRPWGCGWAWGRTPDRIR